MADIEEVIRRVIDESWSVYDQDRSGCLNKAETRQLLDASFGHLDNAVDVQHDDFENIFAGFDRDGSGTISKEEMADFIRQVAGMGKNHGRDPDSSGASSNAGGRFKNTFMNNMGQKGMFAKQLANAFI